MAKGTFFRTRLVHVPLEEEEEENCEDMVTLDDWNVSRRSILGFIAVSHRGLVVHLRSARASAEMEWSLFCVLFSLAHLLS